MKMIRIFKGVTQAKLSVLSGVDVSLVSRIETGSVRNTPGIIEAKKRIADALEMSVHALFPQAKD